MRAIGGASRWWLHHFLARLQLKLRNLGVTRSFGRGPTLQTVSKALAECGGDAVLSGTADTIQPKLQWMPN
ncbi:hypothetical protein [Mesorhizobium sp. M0435]|uniref:hypothetical protein n=1 Tax=unclassified Mesorhizobium TaxID=325217 RepID=UPI0033368945